MGLRAGLDKCGKSRPHRDSIPGQMMYGMHKYKYRVVTGARGGVVVKALRYKPAGQGFDSPWCHWNFSVTYSCRSHYGSGVDSASNSNEYQVYFLEVKAAGA
jgi:hypothetical protein